MAERLQKVLANAGLASRREIERWIEAGRIVVNGEVAQLGCKVTPTDRIQVDGRTVAAKRDRDNEERYLMYHKPAGEICTRNDSEGRKTVFEALPPLSGQRWVSVGRLDINTSGLLLFMTDGNLANALMHPSTGVARRYMVRVRGTPADKVVEQLLTGVALEDGEAKFDSVERRGGEASNVWYEVALSEGRNREVRRLWEAVGCEVSRLTRIAYGPIELGRKLPRGRWQYLSESQVSTLKNAATPVMKGEAS